MATPIEEPERLPGTDVYNQVGERIGTVEQLYGPGGDGPPGWAGVAVRTGLMGRRLVLVPLARFKFEDEQVRVPYDTQHLLDAPEVDGKGGLSDEDAALLSDYFAVGRGDQATDDNPGSYASQMPDADDPPEPIDSSG
jgi:hypothetical protein